MGPVTQFLLRWLYLSGLVDNNAQELQWTPQQYQHLPPQYPSPPSPLHLDPLHYQHQQQQQYQLPPPSSLHVPSLSLREWQRSALHGLATYPPGIARLLAYDSLRMELIRDLFQQLKDAYRALGRNSSVRRNAAFKRLPAAVPTLYKNHMQDTGRGGSEAGHFQQDLSHRSPEGHVSEKDDASVLTSGVEGSDLGAQEAFATFAQGGSTEDVGNATVADTSTIPPPAEKDDNRIERRWHEKQEAFDAAKLALQQAEEVERQRHNREVQQAKIIVKDLYENLPQLVSAVLHSPLATTPNLNLDPIFALRKLLLTTCMRDPNMGIALCWLLEAEVGRAWKTLFEHKEKTGRILRLVVIGPEEKGLLLAKIGIEKQGAFDLLQDANQATAFGSNSLGNLKDPDVPPRLAADSSLRRCSHFGDTMQFIDQLTQISLDLRAVPVIHRYAVLQEKLSELNRRLRRRMVTQGSLNLDVDDNYGPHDWPHVSDVTMEMLCYSVHFPLQPACVKWPDGEFPAASMMEDEDGVVRVLNIVSTECRLLASRERCPFLVQMEVVETGLEGSDPRLFDGGASDIGVALDDQLGVLDARQHQYDHFGRETPLGHFSQDANLHPSTFSSGEQTYPLFRGGWQGDESFYYHDEQGFMSNEHYDRMRQLSIEQLHEQMMGGTQTPQQDQQQQPQIHSRNLPVGPALLDKIYGAKWSQRCELIRQFSPYGRIKGWKLASFIMKAGEDIRREALVMQVISKLNKWFDEDLPPAQRPFLRPYTIMCVGGDSGLLECVPDAKSVDEVKKECLGFTTLRDYFERAFGPPQQRAAEAAPHVHGNAYSMTSYPAPLASDAGGSTISFEQAQDNFLRSLVGYSLVCYILQVKDRHNANILLSRDGHLLHIDFGFVLGDTPKMGKVPIFSERAPFKLTAEFWEVIGGWNTKEGGLGVKFCKMLDAAFACASSHAEELAGLIEAAMLNLTRSPSEARAIADDVRSRLRMRGPPNSPQQKQFIMDLVDTALNSWGTSTYDWLQKSMNGYQ